MTRKNKGGGKLRVEEALPRLPSEKRKSESSIAPNLIRSLKQLKETPCFIYQINEPNVQTPRYCHAF